MALLGDKTNSGAFRLDMTCCEHQEIRRGPRSRPVSPMRYQPALTPEPLHPQRSSSPYGSRPSSSGDSNVAQTRKPRDQRNLFDAKPGQEDENVQEWFAILDSANKLLDEQRIGKFKRVKIAILDTGIDMTNDAFSTPEAKQRIARRVDFVGENPSRADAHDICGHGSHCAGLLRRVAPAADIYVARIAEGFDMGFDDEIVAKAIERACRPKQRGKENWDVDIITMSFGFHGERPRIGEAIREALGYDKLIFAAASNSGTRQNVAYPAWLGGVVCINSSNGDGTPSQFNPHVGFPNNFSILGENVPSAWIPWAPDPGANPTMLVRTKIMSGTSMATPIAAAVVSLLLEVALNPGEASVRRIFDHFLPKMRKYEGIEEILKEASIPKNDYMVIHPSKLLAGEDRLEIAYWIRDKLRWKYPEPLRSPEDSRTPVLEQGSPNTANVRDQFLETIPPPATIESTASVEAITHGMHRIAFPEANRPSAFPIEESHRENSSSHVPIKIVTTPDIEAAERPLNMPLRPLVVSRPASVSSAPHTPLMPHDGFSSAPDLTRGAVHRHSLFYTLTDSHEHMVPDANSYWRRLTLPAYEIYERIYERCRDSSGKVPYTSFAAQFLASMPPARGTIEKTWSRLFIDKSRVANGTVVNIGSSYHSKGLAMATLYMLHMESFQPSFVPLDDDQIPGVAKKRCKRLRGFGTWVPCRCKSGCDVEWNFVNDIGLHRPGDPKSCKLSRFIHNGGKGSLFSSGRKEEEALEKTRQDWIDSLARLA